MRAQPLVRPGVPQRCKCAALLLYLFDLPVLRRPSHFGTIRARPFSRAQKRCPRNHVKYAKGAPVQRYQTGPQIDMTGMHQREHVPPTGQLQIEILTRRRPAIVNAIWIRRRAAGRSSFWIDIVQCAVQIPRVLDRVLNFNGVAWARLIEQEFA